MVCPYCGYEYDDTESRCPFCHTENTGQARKQQENVIRTLENETEDIRQMPKQVLHRTNRKAAKIFVTLAAVLLFLTLLILIINFAGQRFHTSAEERNLRTLEQFLQEKDYEAIVNFTEEHDIYESAYDKYLEVAYAYQHILYLEESLEWLSESVESPSSDTDTTLAYLSFAISDCMNALHIARYHLEDNLILGNEEALESIFLQAESTLTETLCVIPEEIEEMSALDTDYYDTDTVLPYAQSALKRME